LNRKYKIVANLQEIIQDMSSSAAVIPVRDETQLEYISDAVLGIAFLIVGIVAAQR
jgi:hypothetical protein